MLGKKIRDGEKQKKGLNKVPQDHHDFQSWRHANQPPQLQKVGLITKPN